MIHMTPISFALITGFNINIKAKLPDNSISKRKCLDNKGIGLLSGQNDLIINGWTDPLDSGGTNVVNY